MMILLWLSAVNVLGLMWKLIIDLNFEINDLLLIRNFCIIWKFFFILILLYVYMRKVVQVIDVCNRYWCIAILSMDCGHINILTAWVDSPGLTMIPHDFFDVPREISEPILVSEILRSWLLLWVFLFLFLLIDLSQLLKMCRVLNHLYKVFAASITSDIFIFVMDDFVESTFASVAEELCGRLHNYNIIIILINEKDFNHNSINTEC